MTPLDALLISTIVSLAGVVGFLWKQNNGLRDQQRKDQLDSSRLIFGLMAKVTAARRQTPPATISEWEDEPNTQVTKAQFTEAKKVANNELNGDVEMLVKNFLNGTPSTRP